MRNPNTWNHRDKHKHPPRNRVKLKGVYFMKNLAGLRKPWKAYARRHGQQILLGYFTSKWEAAVAYNRWAWKTHGPGTYLNPVPVECATLAA